MIFLGMIKNNYYNMEDYSHQKRRKGSDKAKERFERNGKFSSKAIRQKEELLEKTKENRKNK